METEKRGRKKERREKKRRGASSADLASMWRTVGEYGSDYKQELVGVWNEWSIGLDLGCCKKKENMNNNKSHCSPSAQYFVVGTVLKSKESASFHFFGLLRKACAKTILEISPL